TAMLEPGAIEPRAGKREHVEGKIETEAALDLRAEQLEHAAGAGAEIEQGADRGIRQRREDRHLDRLIGDMELANAVPLRRALAEIVLRRGCALRAHGSEALTIAREHRVVGIKAGNEFAGELGGAVALGQAEEGPRAFAETLDQAGLGEQPQMARDARLGLAQ